MRGFHQGEITLIEHGTQNREKQVTVPGVIMESRTGERSISNPKPNGLRRACCRREREIKSNERVKNRGHCGDSLFPLQALTSAVKDLSGSGLL